MVPMGWAIEVDAEPARRIQFGNEVLDMRLGVGWDAAVVFLGNNYVSAGPEWFESQLNRIIDRLSPRPIVLFTVTLVSEKKIAVNEMIRAAAAAHDNIVILDWEAFTTTHPEVLRTDGLHVTEEGRQILTDELARVLGPAPTQPGECLGTSFFDDSGMPADEDCYGASAVERCGGNVAQHSIDSQRSGSTQTSGRVSHKGSFNGVRSQLVRIHDHHPKTAATTSSGTNNVQLHCRARRDR